MKDSNLNIIPTRQRILDVAARQFRVNGYSAVGLRSIAEEAGIKAGSLYYHFNSKDEIVVEVLNIGIRLVHDAVEVSVIQSNTLGYSAQQILREAIGAHLSAFLEWSDYTSANIRIFAQLPDFVRNKNAKARSDYEQLWDSILIELDNNDGVASAKSRCITRLFLLGAMNASIEWFDPSKGSIEDLADQYTQIMLHGLLARGD